MKITILSLFPTFFEQFQNTSIIKRAIDKGLVEIEIVNFRDFSKDRLKRVDYPPIGGGAGMIITLQPILDCLNSLKQDNSKVYLLSAKGKLFKQKMARSLSKEEHIILICGHYEGIDDRILHYIDGEICIGDYILTGGEIPAMIVSDAIIRLLDGAIKEESTSDESFENELLEYPQFCNERNFEGYEVPAILFTGNHKAIHEWRVKKSIETTKKNRPDLFDESKLDKETKRIYSKMEDNSLEQEAILKAKKFIK